MTLENAATTAEPVTEATSETSENQEDGWSKSYNSRPPTLLSDTYDIFACENWIHPTSTDDLDLENLPNFNFNIDAFVDTDFSDLSDLSDPSDVPSIDLSELDFSFLDDTQPTDPTDPTDPSLYDPCLLPDDAYTFIHNSDHNCGYCGRPAGWQSNTQHFIQLRSGRRYACFACLRTRWQQRTIYHKPKSNSNSKRHTTTKTHHRRLPRRRILGDKNKQQQESTEQPQQ
jgi:hypothetical protein